MTLIFQEIWLVRYLWLMDNATSWEVDDEAIASENSCFAEVREKKSSKCTIMQFQTV